MNERFNALEQDRQTVIINAALKEFATHSYSKASTNTIVKEANISKGILFHYFKNKQNLYDFLQDFSFKTIVNTLEHNIDWDERDFFIRLKQAWVIKSTLLVKYPHLVKFSERFLAHESMEDILKLLSKYNATIAEDIYKKNIDFTKFKDDIGIDKAINIVQWTFEKLGENWRSKLNEVNSESINELSQEIDAYLIILKRTFYKEEAMHD